MLRPVHFSLVPASRRCDTVLISARILYRWCEVRQWMPVAVT